MKITAYKSADMQANMYIIAENGHALVVDPSRDEAAFALISSECDFVDLLLLTHEHCDHISGAESLRHRYACPILASAACKDNLLDTRMNYSHYFDALNSIQTRISGGKVHMQPFTLTADQCFNNEKELEWQGYSLFLKETPGHSQGSICLLLDGKQLFSGDSIFLNEETITRFRGGSKRAFTTLTLPWLENLDKNITVYPGHFEPFVLGDRLK